MRTHPELLYVGRLMEHKRVDVLLHAFALLLPSQPTLRLGIVGTGPEPSRLTELAGALDLGGQVHLYGLIEDHRNVLALMKGARVFVSPSEREGFGFTVAESLAVGTPVVTADATANESRRLVAPGTTGQLAAPVTLRRSRA